MAPFWWRTSVKNVAAVRASISPTSACGWLASTAATSV
jgi:hypothetical protein